MELKVLMYFLEVCKTESFASAARNCYISPQGLGKAIRLLETELNVSLFKTDHKGQQLTEEGKCLKQYAMSVLKLNDVLMQELDLLKSRKNTVIKVGFAYGTLGSISLDSLTEFHAQFPHIQIIAEDVPDIQCETNLNQGIYDLAVTVAPYNHVHFNTIPLRKEKHYFWVNKENPLSLQKMITYEDLQTQTIMMVGKEFKSYHNLIFDCKQRGFDVKIRYTSSEMGLLKQWVKENRGIASTVEHEVLTTFDDEITAIPFENHSWEFGISTRKIHGLSTEEKEFIQFLEKYIQSHPINV